MIEIKINILKKFSKNPPKTLEPYVPMTPNKDTTCSYLVPIQLIIQIDKVELLSYNFSTHTHTPRIDKGKS